MNLWKVLLESMHRTNSDKTIEQIQRERDARNPDRANDPRLMRRHYNGEYAGKRDIALKQHGATRNVYETSKYYSRANAPAGERDWRDMRATVSNSKKKELLNNNAQDAYNRSKNKYAASRAVHNTEFRSKPIYRHDDGTVTFRYTAKSRW